MNKLISDLQFDQLFIRQMMSSLWIPSIISTKPFNEREWFVVRTAQLVELKWLLSACWVMAACLRMASSGCEIPSLYASILTSFPSALGISRVRQILYRRGSGISKTFVLYFCVCDSADHIIRLPCSRPSAMAPFCTMRDWGNGMGGRARICSWTSSTVNKKVNQML